MLIYRKMEGKIFMGSITNYNSLNRFKNAFSDRLTEHFSYLKGQTVSVVSDTDIDFWVITYIDISSGDFFEIHHSWATEEEINTGEEILEDGDLSTYSFVKQFVLNKKIKDIYVNSSDRDDEMYLVLELENSIHLHARLGFSAYTNEIFGLASEILSAKEIAAFYNREAVK